jgi:hypothetical protein
MKRRTRILLALVIFLAVLIAMMNPFRRKGVEVGLWNQTSLDLAGVKLELGQQSVFIPRLERGKATERFISTPGKETGFRITFQLHDPDISSTARLSSAFSTESRLRSLRLRFVELGQTESGRDLRMLAETEESFDLLRLFSDLYHGRGLGGAKFPAVSWRLARPATGKPKAPAQAFGATGP